MTPKQISEAKFRGPVRFIDGRGGMAQQDFVCIDEPRLSYAWRRENRKDSGRQFYMVDGIEVADFDEAAKILAEPPSPDSPDQQVKRSMEEHRQSPRINFATRALSEARRNADVGPFGQIRAWLQRAGSPWHNGINAYSNAQRKSGGDHPDWMYEAKTAAYESFRAMYLFAADRKQDTGLQCALGKSCRDCPMLQQIETSMIASTKHEKFAYDVDEYDIDTAKVWTCITHVLKENTGYLDGMMFSTEEDRKNPW